MKIRQLDVYQQTIPLLPERRMLSALGKHNASHFVVVRLTTEEGAVGAGEATVTPQWSGETAVTAAHMIDQLFAPAVYGMELSPPFDSLRDTLDSLAVGNWFAKSAIEMACWDAFGKLRGQPVYALLGGAKRSLDIPNRFSMGAYSVERAERRAAELVAEGFTTIKVKVGGEVSQDVERVAAVRRAAGPQVTITVDANGGWDVERARKGIPALQDLGVEWFEQPLERGDYSQLRQLRSDLQCKILADESCFDLIHCEELIQQDCCDAITVYPGKHGGIGAAVQIALRAESAGIPCTIGSNLEWDIGAAAMLHFIVATTNVQVESLPGDCLGPSYHEYRIVENPIAIEGPIVTCPSGHGLGVDVDWSRLQPN